MRNPLQAIVSFNEKAGLLKNPFEDKKESAYLIEEALESFDVSYLGRLICLDPSKIDSPKEVARGLIANTLPLKEPLAKEHIVDKYLDAVVFPIGALAKMGLTHQDITHLLNVVTDCNMKKLTVGTDSEGKQLKPDDWVGPEEKIKAYLISKGLY